jgi:hypothetical protein
MSAHPILLARRLLSATWDDRGLSDDEIQRTGDVLLALEVVFANDVVASGLDWRFTSVVKGAS